MRGFLSDLRQAVRTLRTQRAFSLTVVLTLALGIGMTTAIFSVVDGIVLRPLPFPAAGRLVSICEQYPGATPDWCSISPPNVEDIAVRSRTIEAVGIARSWPYHLLTASGNEAVSGGLATPGIFAALGVRPVLGRMIQSSDLIGRQSTVALLTWDFWQTRFSGDPGAVGRVMVLDGEPVTIVGILPRGFRMPIIDSPVLWRPLHIDPRDEAHRDWHGFVAFARLRSGASLAALRSELAAIAVPIRRAHFAATQGWGFTAVRLQDLIVGGVRPILLLFLIGALVVLLIGCAHVANLLLARGERKARETALRSALGASRARIARITLVESLVLALMGATLGLVLASWASSAFKALAPDSLPRIDDVRMDVRVLGFAVALALLTTIVFGLLPAIRSARVGIARVLREGGHGAVRGPGRLGRALVVGELALASILVTSAAILVHSFAVLTAWNPGFEREHLLTFSLFAPEPTFTHAMIPALWDRIESELRTIPGVQGVGSASAGPLFGGGDGESEVALDGRPGPEHATVEYYDVSPGYFAALGVPVVRGRPLDSRLRMDAPPEALINETAARRYWPGADAIGKRMTVAAQKADFTIVGVVRDVPALDPTAPVKPQIYWSNRQLPRGFSYFLVRTSVPPQSVAAVVRDRLRLVHRDLRPSNMLTMDDLLGVRVHTPRFDMLLFLAFGSAALLLAAIGTYGLLAYVVSQRTREIGIRIALGAPAVRVIGVVVRQGLVLALTGVLVGAAGSLLVARTMASIAIGVSPVDPMMLLASAAVLLLVATVASLVPARRATSVDPALALLAE